MISVRCGLNSHPVHCGLDASGRTPKPATRTVWGWASTPRGNLTPERISITSTAPTAASRRFWVSLLHQQRLFLNRLFYLPLFQLPHLRCDPPLLLSGIIRRFPEPLDLAIARIPGH